MAEVLQELLVADDEEARPKAPVLLRALLRRPLDDARWHVGRPLPLGDPLRLQRRGNDEQPAPDGASAVQRVARRDRLRRLAEAHVVREQEAACLQKARHSGSLVGVEGATQEPEVAERAA